MQLVNSIIGRKLGISIVIVLISSSAFGQSNSPFSRYGIGDLSNNLNTAFRGMGGANIASTNYRFVNSNNPASYSYLGQPLATSRFKDLGQVISFDVGTEFNATTLKQVNPLTSYKTQNLVFNYMQFATQLSAKGNWGMAFGLQPIARTNYKIANYKRLATNDSAETVYEGSGGAYKAFVGSAYRMNGFSFGFNTGYVFGKKFTSTNITLINDSIQYYESSSNNKYNFGNFFLHTGFLYEAKLGEKKGYASKLTLGGTYELKNRMNSSTDIERLVYEVGNINNPNRGPDSIEVKTNIAGTLVMPQTVGFGFRFERASTEKEADNYIAVSLDYSTTKWSDFRVNNQLDRVQDVWDIRSGFEFKPLLNRKSYWSRGIYRTGFSYGKDYITAGGDLPTYAITLGASLPMRGESIGEIKNVAIPYINLSIEAGRRGNNSVNISENFARVALSVSLTDIWYQKRKYD